MIASTQQQYSQVKLYPPALSLKNKETRKILEQSHYPSQVQKSSPQPTLAQIQGVIASNFSRINKIIDDIENQMIHKFQHYQYQILSIMKEETREISIQMGKLVCELKTRIEDKQSNQLFRYVENESTFFKTEALKLYQINKTLRSEIKALQAIIKEYQNQFEISDLVILRLKKREIKTTLSNKKMQQNGISQLSKDKLKQVKSKNIKQRLNTQGNKKISVLSNHQIEMKRFKTEGVEDTLQNYLNNQNIANCYPHTQGLKLKNIGIQQISLPNRLYLKMQKSIQTQNSTICKNAYTINQSDKKIAFSLPNPAFNIDLEKNGFFVNAPDKMIKGKQLGNSTDCESKFTRNMEKIGRILERNKMKGDGSQFSQESKVSKRYSLFSRNNGV